MNDPDTLQSHAPAEAPMIGDHLAMDMLNTEAHSLGRVVDYWQSGEDVLAWFQRQALASPARMETADLADLLAQAKELRALARRLIKGRLEAQPGDPGSLNSYLHAYLSAPHLALDGEGKVSLTRIVRAEPLAQLLGQLAEAVAQLLAEGDFGLVKQCAHPECILWFYDRTKAHKRRWCSMASCGNRYKAAQFRKRSGTEVA